MIFKLFGGPYLEYQIRSEGPEKKDLGSDDKEENEDNNKIDGKEENYSEKNEKDDNSNLSSSTNDLGGDNNNGVSNNAENMFKDDDCVEKHVVDLEHRDDKDSSSPYSGFVVGPSFS
ncbi:conserved hypothetical protein [Ricinus communis]|uniref:Uncharacterized protein n=1 Tax=Ricinus communis TaxID=3988 RepID=B9SNJ5_RICCO|nr:conserved hypothetical protein [Ricinus communis]